MRISELHIDNFRSIRSLHLTLDETTVFIGANNGGKSAILEAIRIALSRRWGQRGTGFTEDDVYRGDDKADPRTAPPVKIHFEFRESVANRWPAELVANLEEIVSITTDGMNKITVSISYLWNPEKETFEPSWEFLNPDGIPLPPRKRAINLSGFYDYILFFWLGALRDADEEFAARSRNWGGLLRGIKIPNIVEEEVKQTLDDLDAKLLGSDPQLAEIAKTIGRATEIAMDTAPGDARLRMLPLNTWDMLARAGLILRNESIRPWFPLNHHGQGLQSLSIIFLTHAVVAQQLASNQNEGAEPIFAIEEPEVHLHPQAARTLWQRISELPGQKLVTTHSPYFVQNVPIHNLRIVRFKDGSTQIASIPRNIVSELPWTADIEALINGRKTLAWLSKDASSGMLMSTESIPEPITAELENCLKKTIPSSELKPKLQAFRYACRILVSSEEESELAFLARRIRGEIFFAREWILVEGPSEYLLVNALAKSMDYDLDQHGVAIIDFQNNGNPAIYAALAEAFGIPWKMVVDGDSGGESFRDQLLKRGFTEKDLSAHLTGLPKPNDLEDQLLNDGHELVLRKILQTISGISATTCSLDDFRKRLKQKKTAYMTRFAPMVAADPDLAKKMPKEFISLLDQLKKK